MRGRAKAALVEIQHGEYGDGQPELMHATLFADTMRALGLDPTYGAYLDCIPAVTLATVNVMSLFGLHRCWRGALVGHLALLDEFLAVSLAEPRGDIPVDIAHVVAELVFHDLVELHAASAEGGAIFTAQHIFDRVAHAPFELTQQREGRSGGGGSLDWR